MAEEGERVDLCLEMSINVDGSLTMIHKWGCDVENMKLDNLCRPDFHRVPPKYRNFEI